MRISRRTWLAMSVSLSGGLVGVSTSAQTPRQPTRTARANDDSIAKSPETTVVIELLTSASAAEHAQAWGQKLQKLDVQFQTRQGVVGDRPQVTEKKLGRLRQVTVVAVLDRNGKIACSDRSFTLAESERLIEWIRELKTYGAQGAPHGKPLFGLDERQFVAVMKSLSPAVSIETEDLTLEQLLKQLPVPENLPWRLTPEAQRAARLLDPDKVTRQDLRGLSLGSVLSAALGEFGLAFHPLRTPEGKIELAITPREDAGDRWPIGWPLNPDKPQGQVVPALFKMVPVELEDVPLTDVLTAASQSAEIPIVLDHHVIERESIMLDELKVSVPMRKTTWGLLLKQVTFPHKLGRLIVADESGKPFVVVTTLKETLKENPASKK